MATTLNQALQKADQEADIPIACMIVSIHLFFSERSVLVTVLLVDRDGRTFEAKAWSPRKAYYVYFNFREGEYVILRCVPSFFEQSDSRFSGVDYEISRKTWVLEHSDHPFRLKSPFKVHCDITLFHESRKPVKSMVARFVQMGNGPLKFNSEGRVMARGHYCKFRDSKNRIFQVLLWANANRKFPFPLRDCEEDSLVLIPFAREQEQKYRSGRIYTITSLYPPVVSLQCIDVAKINDLFRNAKSQRSEPYNPY